MDLDARPILPVADMGKAVSFYERLGFAVQAYDAGYGIVVLGHHELLHLRYVADLDPGANEASCYLHVSDADEWHTRLTASGAAVTPVVDEPWGMREFSLRDPSGNLIRMGHNL